MNKSKNTIMYVITLLVSLVFVIICVVLVSSPGSDKPPENTEIVEKIPEVMIEDITKYDAVLIINDKVYYSIEEITVPKENIDTQIGQVENKIIYNKRDTYELKDNSAFNCDMGLKIFSIKEDSNIAVENKYLHEYTYFVEDLEKYKEIYNILNRNSESTVYLYRNVVNSDFENFEEYKLSDILGEETPVKNFQLFNSYLLTVKDNGLTYNYNVLFKEDSGYFLADYYNNKYYKLKL